MVFFSKKQVNYLVWKVWTNVKEEFFLLNII